MARRALGTTVSLEFLREHGALARKFLDKAESAGQKVAAVILQNAWSGVYAGDIWPREWWLPALMACPTGQRLRRMSLQCPQVELWYDNTTPIVGPRPSSVVPADYGHIRNLICHLNPHYIVTCGVFAADALTMIRKEQATRLAAGDTFHHGLLRPWLRLPHPVARNAGVTNELFEKAGRLLASGFSGFVEYSSENFEHYAEDENVTGTAVMSLPTGGKPRPSFRMDVESK